MPARQNRNRAALVVIDMQHRVVANAWDRDGVIARTASLVERARGEGVPVIFVQHEDQEMMPETEGWRIVPELAPAGGDPVIRKRYPDAFAATPLASLLDDLGVGHLVVAGAQTDACIRSTMHRALAEGYDMTLVADCHTTDDRIYGELNVTGEQIVHHTNLCMQFVTYPDHASHVVPHTAVSFASPAAQQEEL